MLDTLTIDTFQARLGERFDVIVDERQMMVTRLTRIFSWGEDVAERPRQPFSIVLHALPEAIIPQRIYEVQNAALGSFEIFLTPIGPDQYGMQYEAVFT